MIGLSRGILALLLAGMIGIAYLDYSTGKDLAVWGLYLIPVAVASWMGGFRAGLVLSLVGCLFMFVAGSYGGTRFSSYAFFLLGILNRLIALLMVSWLASYLFRRQMLESTLQSYEEYMDYLNVSPAKQGRHENAGPVSQTQLPADRGH